MNRMLSPCRAQEVAWCRREWPASELPRPPHGGNGNFDTDQPARCLVRLCLVDLAYTEDLLSPPGAGQTEEVSHLRHTIACAHPLNSRAWGPMIMSYIGGTVPAAADP
jgi:hypothetical protein